MKVRKILLIQAVLLVAGGILLAKPVYHFLRREYFRLNAENRWKKALAAKPGVGEEHFWLSVSSADIDTLVLNSEKREDLYDFPSYRQIGKKLNLIIAHRDIHFMRLGEAVTGCQVNLQLRNSQYNSYQVVDAEIVDSENVEKRLQSKSDEDWLVLMTCYPFQYIGPAPQRYLLWCKSKADIPVRLEKYTKTNQTKFLAINRK